MQQMTKMPLKMAWSVQTSGMRSKMTSPTMQGMSNRRDKILLRVLVGIVVAC
jgi:hypothetical protein